jgi:hypothetical protein
MNMIRLYSPAVVITMLAPVLLPAQGTDARYAAADIRVMAPGVVYNAGLSDLACGLLQRDRQESRRHIGRDGPHR